MPRMTLSSRSAGRKRVASLPRLPAAKLEKLRQVAPVCGDRVSGRVAIEAEMVEVFAQAIRHASWRRGASSIQLSSARSACCETASFRSFARREPESELAMMPNVMFVGW